MQSNLDPVFLSTTDIWSRRIFVLTIASWGLSLVFGFVVSLQALMLIGFIVAIIGLRKPIGIIGIGILCTIDAVSRVYVLTGGVFRWNILNYWLLFVIVLHIPFLLRLNNWQTRFLQLFVLLITFQLLVSSNVMVGLQDILSIISVFGILIYFAFVPLKDNENIMHWLGLICGTISAIGGFVYFASVTSNSLIAMNQNAWALFPVAGMITIHLGLRYCTKSRERTIYWILLIINLMWIFLSGSRGGLLLGICITVFCIFNLPNRLEAWVGLLIVGSLATFLITAHFSGLFEYTLHRLERTFNTTIPFESRSNGRSELIEGGWHIFIDNPLGIGTGSFRQEWENLGSLGGELTRRLVGRQVSVHSGWMKTLVENGILGISFLALFVVSYTFLSMRSSRHNLLYGLCTTIVLTLAWTTTEFQGKALWLLAAGTLSILMQGQLQYHLKATIDLIPPNIVPPSRNG